MAELALSPANWATRLAGAGGRRRSDEQGRLGSGQKVIWSLLNLEDSKENVKAEGRGEEADRSSDPARRSDVNSKLGVAGLVRLWRTGRPGSPCDEVRRTFVMDSSGLGVS